MKLTGHAIGILTDTVTGEKTVAFDETNHIQDETLKAMATSWGSTATPIGSNLYINWSVASPVSQRRDLIQMPTQSVDGIAIAGVTSPEYTWYEPNDFVHIKKIVKRFLAPAADITIYTIGVRNTGSPQASVTLTVPCVQTTTQTLDVFYRIQVAYEDGYWDIDWAHDSLVPTPKELELWAKYILGAATVPVKNTVHGANWADKLNPRRLKGMLSGAAANISLVVATIGGTKEYFKIGQKYTLALTANIGRLIGLSHFSDGGFYETTLMHGKHVLSGIENPTPVQNIFGHSSAALVPFYDATTTQGGLGTMTIDGSSWTNPDFPKMLRINVTNTGSLGVGEYKFQMRNIFGFALNTYTNVPHEVIGYHYYNKHLTDGFSIIRGDNSEVSNVYEVRKTTPIITYDNKTILAGWIDEVMISDVPTQEGTRFASDTTPSMSATNITQFCKDLSNGDIYVACRINGLFKITADLLTVTRMYSATPGLSGVTGCYGVNVTTAGRVWAYFGGGSPNFGLYYSDDDGANWIKPAFSHAPIDANPTLVTQVIVDPAHADDQVAVIYGSDLHTVDRRDLYIAWWDKAATVAVAGVCVQGPIVMQVVDYPSAISSNQVPPYALWCDYNVPVTMMNVLKCSPNDGFWVTSMRRLNAITNSGDVTKYTFGSAAVTDALTTDAQANTWQAGGFGVDETGADALFYLTKDGADDVNNWGNFINSQVMMRQDLSFDLHLYHQDNADFDFSRYTIAYLGGGVHLCLQPPAWNSGNPNTEYSTGGVGIVSAAPYDPLLDTDATGTAYDNELYASYGWNGVAWVKGHANGKPMHAAPEVLLDGLTVAFDDATGTTGWEATDFYTSIIFNGIVADGSTTYEQDLHVYFKPAVHSTDLEASVLPATTRIPGNFREFIPKTIADWQDTANVVAGDGYINRATNTNNYDTWNSDARSALVAISGSPSNLSSTSRLPFNDIEGVQGHVEWNFYSAYSSTQPYQQAAGLSNTAKLGGLLTDSTIMYGIKVDSGPTATSGVMTVTVIESGVVKATFDDIFLGGVDNVFRIIVKTDGSVIYEMYNVEAGWIQLYVSAAGTATIEDLHFEYTSSSYGGGIRYIKTYSHISTDHFLFLGNGVDTGLFANKFRFVDPAEVNITIDGSPAFNIGIDDTDTVLTTGQYSVFQHHGVIRYAAVDVGKSITGSFVYVSDEA